MSRISIAGAVDAYSQFKTFTNTNTAKETMIQTVAILVMTNAVYNASRSRLTQATIGMTGGLVLWTNQDAFTHQALSETAGALGIHVTDLNAALEKKRQQIEQMSTLINSMGNLQTEGGVLLSDQAQQLENLKRERAALETQVAELDTTRQQIQQQVEALEMTRKLFDEHIEKTSASIQAALAQSTAPKV